MKVENKNWEDIGKELERRQSEMKRIAKEISKNTLESHEKQIRLREQENQRKRKAETFCTGEKVLLYDQTRTKKEEVCLQSIAVLTKSLQCIKMGTLNWKMKAARL